MPAPRRPLYIAVTILAVGWGIGIAVYLTAVDEDSLPFEMTSDSKRYLNQLERLGGKSVVFYSELGDAISSLWHGSRLGITIGVLSCLVAFVYYKSATSNGARRGRR